MDTELIQRIQGLDHLQYDHEISDEDVDALESALGFLFPADYRSFLGTFGFLMIDGHLIRGVYENDSQELASFGPSVLATLKERASVGRFAGPSPIFIVLEADDGGGYTLLRFLNPGYVVENWQRDGEWYVLERWGGFSEYCGEMVSRAEAAATGASNG